MKNPQTNAPRCACMPSSSDGLSIQATGARRFDMTYSEKLKDPRWAAFRQHAIEFYGCECSNCSGNDTAQGDGIHVHHKRYIRDREPWEYDLDDVSVICGTCHDRIHACETKWRDMIRQMPAWAIQEFDTMAEMVIGMQRGTQITWAARCKNMARDLKGHEVYED